MFDKLNGIILARHTDLVEFGVISLLMLIDSKRNFLGGPVVKISPSTAGGEGSIPGQGVKIPQASRPKNQNIKQKQYCNKFNKDFKKWSASKRKIYIYMYI